MKEERIIAGFGRQGVMSMGKSRAFSEWMGDKKVTWKTAYGTEKRGDTANVTVILANDRISSPIRDKYDIAVVLNQQSLDKFEPKVKPGGILIYDANGINRIPERTDIKVVRIEATKACMEMGNSKTYNMVIMGALLEVMDYKLPMENVIKGLKKSLPERHHKLIPLNEAAIEKGRSLV